MNRWLAWHSKYEMDGPTIIAADLGTGGCKTVLVDEGGEVLASTSSEYASFYPQPGWCEQDPRHWVKSVGTTVRAVLDRAGVSAARVAALGLDGVTHNAVLLDQDGVPLRRSIHFYDTRSRLESEELAEKWGEEIFRRTTNSMSPLWTWPQLLWIKRHEPDIWEKTKTVLFQKDYVRNALAPSPVTDEIDAAGSLLFNPRDNQWIDVFIADLGLMNDCLPEVVPPTEVVGYLSAEGARITGLRQGTPVITGTTDTAAEVFGSGALSAGQGTVKLASVGRITCVAVDPVNHPKVLNYRHVLSDLWYPGTATKNASSAFRWLRDIFWETQNYETMSSEASKIPPGGQGLIFHPHLQGAWVPYWDSKLRGDFIGLTVLHGRAHLARAVMEGVALSMRSGFEFAMGLGLPFDEIRLIGKGASSQVWSQIIADTLDRTILIPAESDAAYGTALLTGIGVGLYPDDKGRISDLIRLKAQVDPHPERARLYDELFQIYQLSDAALKETSHLLSDFETRWRETP